MTGKDFASFFQPKPTPPAAPAPAAPAPAPPVAASTSGPRIDLTKRAPGLIDLSKKAGISLAKHNLAGERAAVYEVLDYSGSMRSFYRDGSVQTFTERVLAAAVHLDDDGSIPVIPFSSVAHPLLEVSVDNYEGRVQAMVDSLGHMGSTNYAAAMRAVIEHYRASGATAPALVIFQTDGSPDSRRDAEKVLCEAAHLPIFWQFVGFGNDSFDFLRKLDELAVPKKRIIDNAGFFHAGSNPSAMDATTLYDNIMGEFPEWLAQARRQGIVAS